MQIRRALGKPLTFSNGIALCALFFALGGTAGAAVMITSNGQVAANTISGHQPPSGKHANLIAGSVNASDLANSVKSSIKVHCPAGLQQGGDLCFDPSPRAATTWFAAMSTCAGKGIRLASPAELTEIFDHTGAPQPYEWTDSSYENGANAYVTMVGDTSSRQLIFEPNQLSGTAPFRCIATPTN